MSLLDVRDLSIRYPGSATAAVDGISFDIARGEAVGIVGESGAGKSQTALSCLGLLPANAQLAGSIEIAGNEVVGASAAALRKLRGRRVAMVFQDPSTALNPYLTIGAQLSLVASPKGGDRRQRVVEMLDLVGLQEPERQFTAWPHQLSGGMRQRALIAAALLGEPDLLIADEPTTALDVTVQAQILELLQQLRRDTGTALLLITHDLGVIAKSCERLLVMDRGRFIEAGPCHDVLTEPQHPFTKRLVDAVPKLQAVAARTATSADETLLEIEQLDISFNDRRRSPFSRRRKFTAVRNVSLQLQRGETLAIVGESGSGKTSLARSIAGLLAQDAGHIEWQGERLALRTERRPMAVRRSIQMVFQDPVASLNPSMTVHRIVAEPLALHRPELSADDIVQRVDELLIRVGLEPALNTRRPHQLSGGQAQRVAIARALINGPSVLICDEALAALDGTVRREILNLLIEEQRRSDLGLILITHDLGLVAEIADRVAVMYRGEIVELSSTSELFARPQQDYTKSLLAAVPQLPPKKTPSTAG